MKDDSSLTSGVAAAAPSVAYAPFGWRVRYTEINGRRYGLRDVGVADQGSMLRCDGSGGARHYTETVCTLPGSIHDEQHARLIAAAPELLEALKQAAIALDDAEVVIDADDCVETFQSIQLARKRISAAIAKADGAAVGKV